MKSLLLSPERTGRGSPYNHKNVVIHYSEGCSDNDINDLTKVIDHVNILFSRARIDLKVSDLVKNIVLVGTAKSFDELTDNIGSSKKWGGIYLIDKDTICLRNYFGGEFHITSDLYGVEMKGEKPSHSNAAYILVHELGHAIHMKHMTEASKNFYNHISQFFISIIRESSNKDIAKAAKVGFRNSAIKELKKILYEVIKLEAFTDSSLDEIQGNLVAEDEYDEDLNEAFGFLDKLNPFSKKMQLKYDNLSDVVNMSLLRKFKDFLILFEEYGEIKELIDELIQKENQMISNIFQDLKDNSSNLRDIPNIFLSSKEIDEFCFDFFEDSLEFTAHDFLYELGKDDVIKNIEGSLKDNQSAKIYKIISEIVNISPKSFRKEFIDILDDYKQLHKGDIAKAASYTVAELFETDYSTVNEFEDFAEHFAHFIVKPGRVSNWNTKRIRNALTMSRAGGSTIMKAHKDTLLLKSYLKRLIENITFEEV